MIHSKLCKFNNNDLTLNVLLRVISLINMIHNRHCHVLRNNNVLSITNTTLWLTILCQPQWS